jgi:hypothetical protein
MLSEEQFAAEQARQKRDRDSFSGGDNGEVDHPFNHNLPLYLHDHITPNLEGMGASHNDYLHDTFYAQYDAHLKGNDLPEPQVSRRGDKENYIGGIDWDEWDDNKHFNESHPIKTDDNNVGPQFVGVATRLMDAQRNRPVTRDLNVNGYSVHNKATSRRWQNGYSRFTLHHKNQEVGEVRWDDDTGEVGYLGVKEGHRHMTSKLLQEAWDYSRKRGHQGPASSNDLTSYSEKIVEKYNPESRGFVRFKGSEECGECGNRAPREEIERYGRCEECATPYMD